MLISLRNLEKSYAQGASRSFVLRRITAEIKAGEFVSIMGPSGAGKSSLLHILGMHDAAWSGEYMFLDYPVHKMSQKERTELHKRHIGFVFQSYNLIPRTRALANVELPLSYAGLPRAQRRELATAALDRVGLADRVHHLPSELSGGQQQRVAIARALVTNPAIILADEPTGNLDSASGAEVLGLFARLSGHGRTIILITHEDEVATHARRVVRIRDGKIIADERPQVQEALS